MAYKPDFHLPKEISVTTVDQARELAMDWQSWTSNMPYPQSLSYGELAYYQNYFEALATKFDLTDEFKENAII